MFNFTELKSIHIEISTRCQASCPMCARNNHGGLENPYLKIKDMSLETFKNILNKDVLNQISHVCMCGNFGDPIMNDDLIEMCQYLKDTNSEINVHIHTNGGARKQDWWQKLYKSLPLKHCVFFAIDGLEDTHHIYRIGTTYQNVIKNASTFISEGGIAEWVYIKFKHNEHQVDEAKERSKNLGFKRFTLKNTNRFIGENKFSVLDKKGNHLYYLEPPNDNQVTIIKVEDIKKFKTNLNDIEIDCYSKKNREIYIDVHGRISPCCFIAHAPYNMPENRNFVSGLKKKVKEQYNSLLEDLGGEEHCDLTKTSISDFMEDSRWHTVWDKYWKDEKLITCAKTCGNFGNSKPKEQIIENIQL